MQKTIVIPVDGSKASLKALEVGIDLANAYNDKVKILNVQSNLKELGQIVIDDVTKIVEPTGLSFESKIRVGIPTLEIVSEAKEENTRFIVMPIGKGKAEAVGSVSKRVLEMAPCAVMMVPE